MKENEMCKRQDAAVSTVVSVQKHIIVQKSECSTQNNVLYNGNS
jgi:hypothetical protein